MTLGASFCDKELSVNKYVNSTDQHVHPLCWAKFKRHSKFICISTRSGVLCCSANTDKNWCTEKPWYFELLATSSEMSCKFSNFPSVAQKPLAFQWFKKMISLHLVPQSLRHPYLKQDLKKLEKVQRRAQEWFRATWISFMRKSWKGED